MQLIAITICVNYDDLLAHMIQQNLKFLHKWYIVTSPEDIKTIQLINTFDKEKMQILIYPDFYKDNLRFNKGGALLFAQTYIEERESSANILILDADIYLPDSLPDKLPKYLEDDVLYGAQRTDYWTLNDFKTETNTHPMENANFYGYFQLYKQYKNYMYNDSHNCSLCDDIFRDKFKNKQMLDICVKHLGQNGPNWNGRNYENGIF